MYGARGGRDNGYLRMLTGEDKRPYLGTKGGSNLRWVKKNRKGMNGTELAKRGDQKLFSKKHRRGPKLRKTHLQEKSKLLTGKAAAKTPSKTL